MNNKKLSIASGVALIALLLNFSLALAHESVTIGDYEIEYGWLNEPVIVDQLNAFVVNVLTTGSGEAQPVEDASGLTVTVSYGGQSKTLTLQPLGEDTPGQFVAPILPTIPGQYTLTLSGKLGDTDVKNVEVEPEEVETADTLQFPSVESSVTRTDSGTTQWLIYLSILIGLIALMLSLGAIRATGSSSRT